MGSLKEQFGKVCFVCTVGALSQVPPSEWHETLFVVEVEFVLHLRLRHLLKIML